MEGRKAEGMGRKWWAWTWRGKNECHLRRRDHLVEVQVNKPETGQLPTKVLRSAELEMTRTELKSILTRDGPPNL